MFRIGFDKESIAVRWCDAAGNEHSRQFSHRVLAVRWGRHPLAFVDFVGPLRFYEERLRDVQSGSARWTEYICNGERVFHST